MSNQSDEDQEKIAHAIDSLYQQVTVVSVTVGMILKAASKVETPEIKQLRDDLNNMSQALKPVIKDKRAAELLELLARSVNVGDKQ